MINIHNEIGKQLKLLKELDLIIYSPDFENSTFKSKQIMINKKRKELKKLNFLYGIKKALSKEE